MGSQPPLVVAHRGASAHQAEHTLGAYATALEQGADALECDVRVSRDGHLVCVHDRRIDRVSTGKGVVSELTVAAMSALDFGSWHRADPHSADDLIHEPLGFTSALEPQRKLLTLDNLLGLLSSCARAEPVRLFVETKHPVRYGGLVERKLVEVLRRHGLAEPRHKSESAVLMMSFSSAAVKRFRRAAPQLPTVLLFDKFAGRRTGSLPPWADHAGPNIGLLRADPDYVARAADHGHSTYCWTVDKPSDVHLAQQAGVEFLATNTPAITRSRLTV